MTDLFIYAAAGFMVWMSLDCIQRREHFIWIIIMIILFPVGAVAYFFVVKNRVGGKALGSLASGKAQAAGGGGVISARRGAAIGGRVVDGDGLRGGGRQGDRESGVLGIFIGGADISDRQARGVVIGDGQGAAGI